MFIQGPGAGDGSPEAGRPETGECIVLSELTVDAIAAYTGVSSIRDPSKIPGPICMEPENLTSFKQADWLHSQMKASRQAPNA
jgi:hypothetical protein